MVETIANGAVNIGIVSYLQDKEKKLLQKAEQNDLHAEKLAEDERCIMLSAKNPLSQKEIYNLSHKFVQESPFFYNNCHWYTI